METRSSKSQFQDSTCLLFETQNLCTELSWLMEDDVTLVHVVAAFAFREPNLPLCLLPVELLGWSLPIRLMCAQLLLGKTTAVFRLLSKLLGYDYVS